MPIYALSEDIKGFHEWLEEIYREEEYPEKISPGYKYEEQIELIADIAQWDTLFDEPLYNTIRKKAAYYLYSICSSHAFNDGNKRTALVTTYYFLLWNRHFFNIPPDADKFLFKLADGKTGLECEDVEIWLNAHTISRFSMYPRNLCLYALLWVTSRVDINILNSFAGYCLFMPLPEVMHHVRNRDKEETD